MGDSFKPMSAEELREIAGEFGKQISGRGNNKGLTAVARVLGVSRSAVARYVSGDRGIDDNKARNLRWLASRRIDLSRYLAETNEPYQATAIRRSAEGN